MGKTPQSLKKTESIAAGRNCIKFAMLGTGFASPAAAVNIDAVHCRSIDLGSRT